MKGKLHLSDANSRVPWMSLSGPIAGHVGDGNFHCLIVLDPSDPEEVHRVHLFTERLAR